MELIPGMQDRFNIQKSNNVTYHINRTKNIYDHLNIYKESIWQNSIPTHNLKKKLTSMKNLQLTSYLIANEWECFPTKTRYKARMFTFTVHHIQHHSWSPSYCKTVRRKIHDIQIKKEEIKLQNSQMMWITTSEIPVLRKVYSLI